MDPTVLCSEDETTPAVCCCFCRFPLPALCTEHLSKHSMDTEGFLHFHLPLTAQQFISTREIKAQFDPWLYKLHRAATLLRENEEDLKQFEQQIEAVVCTFESEIAQVKQMVAGLRRAFNAQLQGAIRETSTHAMEQWTPENGSLASLIWNFGTSSHTSLKLFTLYIERYSASALLPVHIESSLASLSHCNYVTDTAMRRVVAQSEVELSRMSTERVNNSELAEARRKNEQLRTENAHLLDTNRKLQINCEQVSKAVEDLKKSIAVQIEKVNKEKEKAVVDCSAEVKRLKFKLAKLKKTSAETLTAIQAENERLKSECREVTVFKEQKLIPFRYQQTAATLQREWDRLKGNPSARQEVASLGFLLGEMLGMHLSQFAGAESTIAETIRIACASTPADTNAMKLWGLKAAVYFHSDLNSDCEAACVQTLESSVRTNTDAELHWTALYHLAFALCAQSKADQAENALRRWSTKPLRNESTLVRLLKMSVRGRVALEVGSNATAENALEEARQFAATYFPTSIYTAVNLFYLGKLYGNTNRIDECKSTLFDANCIFSVHFPGSIYSALTLSWLASLSHDSGQTEDACCKYLEAQAIFARCHPINMHTAVNLGNLAVLYHSAGLLLEAEKTYLQARSLFTAHHPTSTNAAQNLANLSNLYEKMEKFEEAAACTGLSLEVGRSARSRQDRGIPLLERLKRAK